MCTKLIVFNFLLKEVIRHSTLEMSTVPLCVPVMWGWSSSQMGEFCWVTWKRHVIFPGSALIKPRIFFCNVKHTFLYHKPLNQSRCLHTVPEHQWSWVSTTTFAFQHWVLCGFDFKGLICTSKLNFYTWNLNVLLALLVLSSVLQ